MSDSIDPNPHAKMLLGKIEYQKGDTIRAEFLWRSALSTNDKNLKKWLYKTLSNYYAEIRRYRDAYIISKEMNTKSIIAIF